MAAYRRNDFDDRDTYYNDRGPRRGGREVEEEFYERREQRRSPPPRRETREVDEVDVRVRERERESRVPNFMREENNRRGEAGPLVLRQREVETRDISRPRPRSPSPPEFRERIVRRVRSVSPPPPEFRERDEVRTRVFERERERIRSPSRGPDMERLRTRIIERSPSPPAMPMERVRTRVIEQQERRRSPSPDIERERIRTRIIERERERLPSPSPSPPPPPPDPPIIRGPTIEREVITHYTDIDHGMIVARPPSPPPPPPVRKTERETDIDIYTSRNETEVDIRKTTSHSHSRTRARSRSRSRPPPVVYERPAYRDDEILVRSERDRLQVDIEERRGGGHRRARSAAPQSVPYDDEAEYITSRINERGRMGEAYHGATRDWTIVDVPPGTERVRMDGVGGGGADVTWQRYNGVRRAKFVPERESSGALVPVSANTSSTTLITDRETRDRDRDRERERLSVQIYDKDRERDIEVEKISDRRVGGGSGRPPASKRSEMWTEITKDLVVREAIEEMGYEYEETEWFYYVMQYLRYEDVLELVNVSDRIRRARKERAREIQWEREVRDDWSREHRHRRRRDKYEDEVIVDREVVYDRPIRGYLR